MAGATSPVPDRRRWNRLNLAIPLFVKGEDIHGRPFTELAVAVDISAGGALVALQNCVSISGRLSVEVPRPPIPKDVHFPVGPLKMEAKILRTAKQNSYQVVALQFAKPITPSESATLQTSAARD